MCICVCACVHHWAGWWTVPSCSPVLFANCQTPGLMGVKQSRCGSLTSLTFCNPSRSKLGPRCPRDVLGETCKVRTGLTPFYISFKIRSNQFTQSCSYEGFDLSPCTFANQSPEVVLDPLIYHRLSWSMEGDFSAHSSQGWDHIVGQSNLRLGCVPRLWSIPSPAFLLRSTSLKE